MVWVIIGFQGDNLLSNEDAEVLLQEEPLVIIGSALLEPKILK